MTLQTALQDHFDQEWGEEGVVDLHAELSKLIIKTASRTLLGAALLAC